MSHWLAFAIYVFITAITPGPNNLLSPRVTAGVLRCVAIVYWRLN